MDRVRILEEEDRVEAPLYNEMGRQGKLFFRWRSFLPLVLLLPAVAAFSEGAWAERLLGDGAEDLLVLVAFLVSLLGLAVRWVAVGYSHSGTSGRNTRLQRANVLNTTGLYSVTRNPLYLGNFIAILGVVLSVKVWWFALLYCLAYWIYIERIIATEEQFLAEKFGRDYLDWASATPSFFPRWSGWKSPDRGFSVKRVLRREYYGLLGVSAAFFAVEAVMDLAVEGEPVPTWFAEDWPWTAVLVLALAIFLLLHTLKKTTSLLSD